MEKDKATGKVIAEKSELLTEMEMLQIYGSMDWTAKINWWCKNTSNCAKSTSCYRKRKKRKK